jgi:hypothetical protein
MLKKLGLPMLLLSAMLLLSPQAASARWRVRVYGGVTPTYSYQVPYNYYGYEYPYYYSTPMFPYGAYYYNGPYYQHWRHERWEHHRR